MAALASVSFLKEEHEEDLSHAMPVLPVIFIQANRALLAEQRLRSRYYTRGHLV